MTKTLFLVMAIAACGGKKGGGSDECTAAVDKAYLVSKDEIKKVGIDDATSAKMKAITVNRCNTDKWDPKVVTCLSDAKTYDDMLKCTDSLAADQKTKWTNELATVTPKPADTGSAGSGSDAGSGSAAPAAGSGSAGSGSGSAAGSGSGSGDKKGAMNGACKTLGDTLAKAAACDKLPKAARDAYAQVASITDAQQCAATADAILHSASATCGW